MIDISRMAKAAGIGSAVGATIGGIKEASEEDGNILGGIVGGAFIGSIGGAGISAGKQALSVKKLASNTSSEIVEDATKISAKNGAPNNINDLNVAKNVMNFKVGDSSISMSKISDPNNLSSSQIKDLAHMDGITYRSQLRRIDNLSKKDMQRAASTASVELSYQFNDVDMQRKYQNYFNKGIKEAIAIESKYI